MSRRNSLWAISRVGLALIGLTAIAAAVPGCSSIDAAQLAMQGEFNGTVKAFTAVCEQQANLTDQIDLKRDGLQGQLIERETERWIEKHQGPDGSVNASAEDMVKFITQRDQAVRDRVTSRQVSQEMIVRFRRAYTDMAIVSELVYQKNVDVAEAKQKMRDAAQSVMSVVVGAGTAAGLIAAF